MNKAFKITLATLGGLVLLIFIGLFLATLFVNPNQFKGKITQAVHDSTGRTLTIKGDMSWSLFPWLGININQISLSNAAGFGNSSFADINKASVSLQVLPLLTGDIKVGHIELDGLHLHLMRSAQGVTNWSDLAKPKIQPVSSNNTPVSTSNKTNASSEKSKASLDLSINSLSVTNGDFVWDDAQNNKHFTVSDLTIEGSHVGTGQSFPLSIKTTVKSSQFMQPILIAVKGDFNIAQDFSHFDVDSLMTQVNNLKIEGKVSFNHLNKEPSFSGNINVLPFNLKTWLNSFNITLPTMNQSDALESVGAQLVFNGDMHDLSIKPIVFNLDSTALNGAIDVKNLMMPSINFNLAVNQFNVDNYMPVKQINSAAASASTSGKNKKSSAPIALSDAPINLPIEMLRKLNLHGTFTLNQMIVSRVHISDIKLNVDANNGILKLSPATLNLYQGTANASASLNVQGNLPAYQFALDAKNIQAEPFVNDLMSKDFVTGTGNFAVSITTTGNSIKSLVNHLNGNSRFAFNNGVLKGVDLEYDLAVANALLNKQALPSSPSEKDTPFGSVTGTVIITNGVAKNNDFLIDNKAFVGKGAGMADLNEQSIDYQLNLTTDKIPQLQDYRIPIDVQGVLTSPSVGLSKDDLLSQVLKQQAKSQVQQNFGKYVKNQDVANAINQFFG